MVAHSHLLHQCATQEDVLYFVYRTKKGRLPRKGTGPAWKLNAKSWSKVEFYPVVMQLCLIPTQPTVSAGHSLLNFMEKILEGMMVQLFVEVDCGARSGSGKHTQSSKMEHTHSLTKDNWECTRHIVMADSNLQMSLLSLIRQLSSHTRQTQFLETSTFTYKAGREAGVEGKFSFWHEPSNEPLLSVVQEDVEKYRSNTGSL